MDTNPFRTVRAYLGYAPAAKWAAVAASLVASLGLVAFFPLLYLFADLLVWQGYVPEYDGLPATQQAAFRAEWEALAHDPAVADRAKQLRPPVEKLPDAVEWEFRWRAATYHWLETAVSPEAAEAYLELGGGTAVAPRKQPLGILSTVARSRSAWFGRPVGLLARACPWAWRPAGNPTVAYLTGLFAAALGLAVARGLVLNLGGYAAGVAAREGVTRLRRTVFTHSYRLPPVAIKPAAQEEAGELVSVRCEQVQDGFVAWLTGAVRGPVQTGLLALVLIAVHPALGAAVLLFAGLVWLATGQVVGWYQRDARAAARRTESRLGLLRESVYLCQLVKGYLMDRYSQTRVERHLAELGRAAWRKQRGEAAARSALTTVAVIAGLFVMYLAGRVLLAGGVSLAGLAVTGTALATLVLAASRWSHARHRVARARAAAAVLVEFLDRRGEPGQPIEAEFLQPLSRRLDLVQVSLREPGTGRMLLEDVSLTVPAGSRAAVVYADAEEAYTLAYLLVRFLDPTAGEVKVDGKNVRWVTTESLRSQVCLVLEQALTFTDTAANNIGCGDPGFTLPQIIDAAKLAHAHQFIQALPYGYETPIGAGGVELTVGQRFRIALARALLRDPSLLVIEEPTEPMDPDSVALVDDCLARAQGGRTIVFLARRPATVKAADSVFVLQNGRLAASGRHDDLIVGNELYRLLHFKQSLTSPEPV